MKACLVELQRVGEAVYEVVRHREAGLKRHIIWAGLWCGLGLHLLILLLGIVEANSSVGIQAPLLLFPQLSLCDGINFFKYRQALLQPCHTSSTGTVIADLPPCQDPRSAQRPPLLYC